MTEPHIIHRARSFVHACLQAGEKPRLAGFALSEDCASSTAANWCALAGMTFQRIVAEETMEVAGELLLIGRTTAEVALYLGYTRKSLLRAFKREKGLPPSAWLRAQRRASEAALTEPQPTPLPHEPALESVAGAGG